MDLLRPLKKYYWGVLEGNRPLRKLLSEYVEELSEYVEEMNALVLFYGCTIFPKSARKAIGVRRRWFLKRKTLLLISYYSSPYKSMYGTQRLEKFMKYLSRGGWNLILLTTSPSRMQQDGENETIPNNAEVVRLNACQARELAGRGLMIPDDFVMWVRPAVEAAKKIIVEKRPSAIYATVPPYSNVIAGAICSKLFDLPLISDFRDPWSKIDWAWVIDKPIFRSLNRALEKVILRTSDRVIMADELHYMDDYFQQSNGLKEKLLSISNGYDEEDFARDMVLSTVSSEKFIVSYVGVIYSQESFDCIVQAFRRWYESHPSDLRNIHFEYAGPNGDYFSKSKELPFCWTDHGYVSHSESIAMRKRSQLQIFAQPTSFKEHVLSGKIFEMIRIEVPILAITHPTGAVANLVKKTGTGFVVSQTDIESIANILRNVYQSWLDRIPAVKPKEDIVRQYSRESLAKRLSDVLEHEIARYA